MNSNRIYAESIIVVGPQDTADAIALAPIDAFPQVFATSRMIALMEVAAARAMQPLLGEGQLSVGVSLDIRHTAPTPIGVQVRAVATHLRDEGKFIYFKVEAFDDSGSIGSGEHARVIVEEARLLAGAERRRQNPATLSNSQDAP